MTLAKYIVLFTICSVFGWAFESVFAVVRRGKWESRGFLYGPLCPIYGVGVVAIVLLAKAAVAELGLTLEWYGVFLVGFFGSMVLEYTVSWALERLFNAYWWDYTNMPLNFNGRTCVPAGLLFGGGGLFAVYVVAPWWDAVARAVPPLAMELAAFAIVVVITIDATLTVNALTQFQKRVEAVDRMLNERAGEATEKLVSFKPEPIERLKQGGEYIKESGERIKQGGDRVRAETERLREQAAEQLMGTFDVFQRAALRRVKGFRSTSLSSLFQNLKSRRK